MSTFHHRLRRKVVKHATKIVIFFLLLLLWVFFIWHWQVAGGKKAFNLLVQTTPQTQQLLHIPATTIPKKSLPSSSNAARNLRELLDARVLQAARAELGGGGGQCGAENQRRRLFYNRVPKSGSSSLRLLLQHLSVMNNFTHVSSDILDDWFLGSTAQQVQFIREFCAFPPGASYDRHLYFVNFTHFGVADAAQPFYINLVREPAARFVSQFNFRRQNALKDVEVQNDHKNKLNAYFDLDLLHCLQQRTNDDCLLDEGRYFKLGLIGFFCGQSLDCLQVNSRKALETAKQNVLQYYQVVGARTELLYYCSFSLANLLTIVSATQILEDMATTLKVLEHKLPQYFRGAQAEFYRQSHAGIYENEAKFLPTEHRQHHTVIDPKISAILKQNLSSEFEFYDFIRERLYRQAAEIEDSA